MAMRIAREVRRGDHLGESKIAKVSSLTHAFRVPGSSTRFHDVTKALQTQGIHLDSDWRDDSNAVDIRRSGVVRLFAQDGSPTHSNPELNAHIQMSIWRFGEPGRDGSFPPDEAPSERDVLWFNIDPMSPPDPEDRVSVDEDGGPDRLASNGGGTSHTEVSHSAHNQTAEGRLEQRAHELVSQLNPWCHGLDVEMMRDLLREDPQPKVETYGDENGSVRCVSVVAAIARELPGEDDDPDGVSEKLLA